MNSGRLSAANDTNHAAYFVDQGALEEIRGVPGRCEVNLSCRANHRCGGWQVRHFKTMHGMGSGVFEIALRFHGDAFRVVHAVQLGEEIWVVHAFQKKSTQGIKTPQREIDLIKNRLNRLKEMLG